MECVVSDINTVYYYPPPDQLRQYITQLRQELGARLVEKVYASGDKPSKVRLQPLLILCTSEKELCNNQGIIFLSLHLGVGGSRF